jgi:hypothetical protein
MNRNAPKVAAVVIISAAILNLGFAEHGSPIKLDPPVNTLATTPSAVSLTFQSTRASGWAA